MTRSFRSMRRLSFGLILMAAGTGALAQPPASVTPMAGPARALPADTSAAKPHALAGQWVLNWVGEERVTPLEISAIETQGASTRFAGALIALSGEKCPLSGRVVDETRMHYTDGIVVTRFVMQTFATFVADCPGQRIRFDLLGFPDGKILLSGRAVAETGGDLRSVVALTRQGN